MIKQLISFFLILLAISCTPKPELSFKDYNFEIKGLDWDANPYKFSAIIQDSVLPEMGNELATWDYAYVGNIEKLHATWDMSAEENPPATPEQKEWFQKLERHDAIELIVDRANNSRVTIINEAHHMPQHRAFTASLLKELYDQGYRHLGMESMFYYPLSDSLLRTDKYPRLINGYYIKDPQYGNIVRIALDLGYQLFGYESNGHNSPLEREINQARNIEKYINENPDGKYLIHCGFAHALEGKYGSWEKAMAGRLTEYTGINPLTINQTTYSERSSKIYENKYYQLTDVKNPSIFTKDDIIFGEYPDDAWCDIWVFHPRTDSTAHRADWLLYGKRKIVNIDFSDADINCPCLVFAYVKGEEIGAAIPYDLIETQEKNANLVLNNQEFEFIIWNEQKKAIKAYYKD